MTHGPCPCFSGHDYAACCEAAHLGHPARNAEALMRSRYAAFALGRYDYIMNTTHHSNPQYQEDTVAWAKDLADFARGTQFLGLSISEFVDGDDEAFVTFHAELRQNGHDVSFSERSRFFKENGAWIYVDGVILGAADD